eukprot:4060420-Pyramimonas_sp.AAC.1
MYVRSAQRGASPPRIAHPGRVRAGGTASADQHEDSQGCTIFPQGCSRFPQACAEPPRIHNIPPGSRFRHR